MPAAKKKTVKKTVKRVPRKRVSRSAVAAKDTSPASMSMMRRCVASCRLKLTCPTFWGTLPQPLRGLLILLFGVLFGIVGTYAVLFSFQGTFLSRIAAEEEAYLLDTVTVEKEVDTSFLPPTGQQRPPTIFSQVELQEFWEAWKYLEQEFVALPEQVGEETVGVFEEPPALPSEEEFVHGAIRGLASALKDPHTNFFAPEDAGEFKEAVVEGEAHGAIGAYITLTEENELTIVRVFDDSPAFHGGIQSDDIVLEIDSVSAKGYSLDEAIEKIRGPVDTPVQLLFLRPSTGETFSLTLLRDQVVIPTVETEVRDSVFVIRLLTFTKQTPEAFVAALQEFVSRAQTSGGPTRLLIDLQGNSGGILSVAMYISGLLVPDNSVIFYEYTGDEVLQVYRSKQSAFRGDVPKMTVLVDEDTASASEILAAALRFHGIADIVGVQTLGKGSVQTLRSVGEEGAFLKITTSHWLTPQKEPIGGIGIIPDVSFDEALATFTEEERTSEERREFLLEQAVEHLQGR